MEQRTSEWFEARRGKFTSSQFHRLMGIKAIGKTGESYIEEVLNDAVYGIKTEFTNEYIEWGINHEPEALEKLSEWLKLNQHDSDIQSVGFYECVVGEGLVGRVGGSPDGLTSDYLIEIKCPKTTTHKGYLMNEFSLFEKYKWQVIGNMWLTGRTKALIASYDPRFEILPLYVEEVSLFDYQKELKLLKSRLLEACKIYDEMVEKENMRINELILNQI